MKWMRLFARLKRLRPAPNLAVWRSWEQTSRAAALGCIGISVFAQGETINPRRLGVGALCLTGNAFIAHIVGELEGRR